VRLSAAAGVLAVLALLAGACSKSAKGNRAPEITLETLLQAPQPRLGRLSELRGKVVVLEFWATWCDPCIEEIPHLNSLQDALAGKPVEFISISDEPKDKIEAFLKSHPMKGWIAADAKPAFEAFGVRGRPATFVIDAKGNLAGRTYPAFLRAEDINAVLAGKPLERLSGEEAVPAALGSPATGGVLLEARISSATGTAMSFSSSEESFKGRGLDAKTLLAQAYGVNESRILIEPPLAARFDADVSVPEGEALAPVFQAAASSALKRSLAKEKRQVEAGVLTKSAAGAKLKVAARKNGKHGFSTGPGRITGAGMGLAELCDAIDQWQGIPVVDETGLKERYDFELTWDYHKPGALEAALASQLGLFLRKDRRKIEMLVFRGAR
jgi:uncharacterized protein (TIGR03435 family)